MIYRWSFTVPKESTAFSSVRSLRVESNGLAPGNTMGPRPPLHRRQLPDCPSLVTPQIHPRLSWTFSLFFPTEPRQPVNPAWQQKEDTHCKRLRTRQMPTRLQEHCEFASQPPQYPHRMVAEGKRRLWTKNNQPAKWFVHGVQAPFQCSEPAGGAQWPLHAIVPHPLA